MTKRKVVSLLSKLSSAKSSECLLNGIHLIKPYEKRFLTISFLNQHALNLAVESEAFYDALQNSDILLRDGIGIKIAQKIKRKVIGPNFNGTDLIPLIIEKVKASDSVEFFVFGTEEPWLTKGVENLIGNHDVVQRTGFFSDVEYINLLKKNHNPNAFNVVILAMGMPKQEMLAESIKKEISASGLIISGGAIIDFYAQRQPRAPKWMRDLSLEWLYRLIKEPKRLFKRYVIGIPKFFYYLLVGK